MYGLCQKLVRVFSIGFPGLPDHIEKARNESNFPDIHACEHGLRAQAFVYVADCMAG